MSNRGWLVTNPGTKRQRCIAESAGYTPPAWMAFLAPADVAAARQPGRLALDRRRAAAGSLERMVFLSSLLPDLPQFREAADDLRARVSRLRSDAIGVDVAELLRDDPEVPGLAVLVGVVERGESGYAHTIPPRTQTNPFTGEPVRLDAVHLRSARDLLLYVCGIDPGELTVRSDATARE